MLFDLRTGHREVVGTTAIISRNGRFLYNGEVLIDRATGTSRAVPAATVVGNEGSVLYKDRDSLHRIAPDGSDRVVMTGLRFGNIYTADDNATVAGVVLGPAPPIVVNTITGEQVSLHDLRAEAASPWISADGTQMVFSSRFPDQVMLCRIDGLDCRPLTAFPEGARPIAISGDASIFYARTNDNRILRLDPGAGQVEVAFAIPLLSTLSERPLVPGSLVRFYAQNPGDHVTLNGRRVPLLSLPTGLPVIQIPWDLKDQWVRFTMYGGSSPFETFTPAYPVSTFAPQGFVPGHVGLNEGQPAYRQDWSATTYQSPAVPGEIVHIYAVGLGATTCAVETGQSAPVDRLCPITRPAEWKWTTAPDVTVPAEVLYAGLAPGTIGLYQVDVRVPPYRGYEFIDLSEGDANARVAFVRIRMQRARRR
jgi:uncharacterized protein (TIGR03437 family)